MTDKIELKASFWQKFKKRLRYNRAKANYLDALEGLSPLRREEEVKRLVKDVMPDRHLHLNPPKKTGPALWKQVKFPSGETP